MPETKRDFYGVCPTCWSVRVKRRIFKSPKYLCEVCGETFIQKKRITHDQRNLFNDALKVMRISAWGHPALPEKTVRSIVAMECRKVLEHSPSVSVQSSERLKCEK